jgi:hypothetical protein
MRFDEPYTRPHRSHGRFFLMVMLFGPVSAEVITAVVPLAQKAPEKDEPAQRRDDQYVGNAFGAQHEIVQRMDDVSHDFVLRCALFNPG